MRVMRRADHGQRAAPRVRRSGSRLYRCPDETCSARWVGVPGSVAEQCFLSQVDGEAVVVDRQGRSSFGPLQEHLSIGKGAVAATFPCSQPFHASAAISSESMWTLAPAPQSR